jgi:hypothetical protein
MRWRQKYRDWYRKYDGAIEFLGLVVVAPCVVYALIFHSLAPDTDGQSLVAVVLAGAGMAIWFARNH